MTEGIRAVFDTNVFISAFLSKSPTSPAKELLQRWRRCEFILVVCQEQMDELIAKLLQFRLPEQLIVRLVADIELLAETFLLDAESIPRVITADPDDDIMIACAVQARVGFLVTNDRHFDVLGGSFRDVKVVDTLHFLRIVRGDSPPSNKNAV